MKFDELMKLINAGYTKEEINKLITPEPAETKPEEKKPEQEEKKPAETKPASGSSNVLTDLVEQLKTFNANIQGMNVLNASMGEINKEKSMEDLIANIIMPPENKKGDK